MNLPASCLNCGQSLEPLSKYCPACGQKVAVHRLSFHELWHDVVHYFTHADKGIFFLLGQLATRPGMVAREFIEGKRSKYFKPLNFWLIIAGVLVFSTSLFYNVDESRSQGMEQRAQQITDPVQKNHLLEMAERNRTINKITAKYSNIINMVATPLLAIFFWLAYYRGKYNYVEHLVANMYFVGFVILFYSIIIFPLRNLVSGKTGLGIMGVFFLVEIIYRAGLIIK